MVSEDKIKQEIKKLRVKCLEQRIVYEQASKLADKEKSKWRGLIDELKSKKSELSFFKPLSVW